MNKIKLIVTSTFFACTLVINADAEEIEATVPAAAATTQASAVENSTASISAQTPQTAPTQKKSWWDAILNLFKITEKKRTTEQAFDNMVENQNVVIDFSNVSDFAQNGDAKMAEYYQKLISTKSFGTKSPNIYVNLSNTGVSLDFISKWAAQFKKDNKNVIWNLSDNKNLDDTVIDALDFSSVYSINLSGTSVSDTGIAKIVAILETSGIGNLVCIHLSGSKVTDAGVNSLKSSMQKAVENWKSRNPGKEYKLQGADNSGVVFEKIPDLVKKGKADKSAQEITSTTSAVSTVSAAAMPSSAPTNVAENLETEAISKTEAQKQMPDVAIPTPPQNNVDSTAIMNEEASKGETALEDAATTALSEADAAIESTTSATNAEIPDIG